MGFIGDAGEAILQALASAAPAAAEAGAGAAEAGAGAAGAAGAGLADAAGAGAQGIAQFGADTAPAGVGNFNFSGVGNNPGGMDWTQLGGGAGAGAGGGGKPVTQQLADALGKLGAATKQEHNAAPQQARLSVPSVNAQSQASRGQNTLGNLVQLLMQRRMQYGPPDIGSGGGSRGLLGM